MTSTDVDPLVRLVEKATGIRLSDARAVGKHTTLEGATLCVKAAAVLRDQGLHADTCTREEYMDALERAEEELGDGYDRADDVLAL